MGSVVSLQTPPSLDDTVRAIQAKWVASNEFSGKARKARIAAGQMLIALRKRIEAGEAGEGVEWWPWYRSKLGRSRKDAEKIMALAGADDPEAAEVAAREKNAEEQRRSRARKRAAADVSGNRELLNPDGVVPRPIVTGAHREHEGIDWKSSSLPEKTTEDRKAFYARQDAISDADADDVDLPFPLIEALIENSALHWRNAGRISEFFLRLRKLVDRVEAETFADMAAEEAGGGDDQTIDHKEAVPA
jgi:hypothetical protein